MKVTMLSMCGGIAEYVSRAALSMLHSRITRRPGLAAAWETLFAYDVLLVVLTVWKSYHNRFKYVGFAETSLMTVIARDGELHLSSV